MATACVFAELDEHCLFLSITFNFFFHSFRLNNIQVLCDYFVLTSWNYCSNPALRLISVSLHAALMPAGSPDMTPWGTSPPWNEYSLWFKHSHLDWPVGKIIKVVTKKYFQYNSTQWRDHGKRILFQKIHAHSRRIFDFINKSSEWLNKC